MHHTNTGKACTEWGLRISDILSMGSFIYGHVESCLRHPSWILPYCVYWDSSIGSGSWGNKWDGCRLSRDYTWIAQSISLWLWLCTKCAPTGVRRRFRSSGIWHCVVGRVVPDNLNDLTSFEMSQTTQPMTRLQQHCCENLRSCKCDVRYSLRDIWGSRVEV